jgi:phospholipid/cholesterol/gamma-HCH transport system substrate-binding protein
MRLFKSVTTLIAVIAAVAVVAALVLFLVPHGGTKELTAEFPRAVSLYEGSDVKILGVAVGTVEEVKPVGTTVRVRMSYDDQYDVPADAKAVVISPSIVGDRYVQLTPVYDSGPVLADGAELGTDRTAVPLELDEIFGSLNQLNIALGPEGANKPGKDGVGALTRLLDSTARNFGGQGVQFNQTLKDLGQLTKTLANNKDELFGTAEELEKFIGTIAKNDDTVRRFTESLASGSDLLAADRQELSAVLRHLSTALVDVRGFVRDNREALSTNIKGLRRIADIVVKRRGELDEMLRIAPAALNNLALAYNPTTGTLDTRDALGEVASKLNSNPGELLCSLLEEALTPLPNCPLANLPGLGRAAPFKAIEKAQEKARQDVDLSLAGLVEVDK